MEALALEGALLQRALNEGRKLLREKADLEAQLRILGDTLERKEAEIKRLKYHIEYLDAMMEETPLLLGSVKNIPDNERSDSHGETED